MAAVGVVLGVGLSGAMASPYALIEPGPTESVSRGTKGDGLRDSWEDGEGEFLMVTVDVRRASWLDWAASHIPWDETEVAKLDLSGTAKVVSKESMDTSKRTAALVAEKFVSGGVSRVRPEGAKIVEVLSGSAAAAGGLKVGDVVEEVSGTAVLRAEEVGPAVEAAGERVQVVVKRGPHRLAFDVEPVKGKIGVRLDTQYVGEPVLTVDTPGVGGASAGLAMTLAFMDALSPGDLAVGVVAATGTVDEDGNVGGIRGLKQKAAGAKQAGASYLLAPRESVEKGVKYALPVVPVSSVQEAVKYICANGATDEVCKKAGSVGAEKDGSGS